MVKETYFDVDQKGRMLANYEVEGEYEALADSSEEICSLVEGRTDKNFEEIPWPASKQFLPIAPMMLMEAYWEYMGQNKNLATLTKQDPRDLICRCFGAIAAQLSRFLLMILKLERPL